MSRKDGLAFRAVKRIRFGPIAAISAATMALAVTAATATRLASNGTGGFISRWNPMIFQAGGGVSVSCPVTIAGSFHSRTIAKVSGALAGYITESTWSPV
jgi:hypothetical protein